MSPSQALPLLSLSWSSWSALATPGQLSSSLGTPSSSLSESQVAEVRTEDCVPCRLQPRNASPYPTSWKVASGGPLTRAQRGTPSLVSRRGRRIRSRHPSSYTGHDGLIH